MAWRPPPSTHASLPSVASTAHIDGRIPSDPAQYVRRPKVHPSDARGPDRTSSVPSCSPPRGSTPAHAALPPAWLNGLRVREACATDIENLGLERGHRTLRIVGKGNKPTGVIRVVPRTAHTIDVAIAERSAGPSSYAATNPRADSPHGWRTS